MATYANRTCAQCGIRKPQPQMYRSETYVENAKSQTGISSATMVGVFSGDKKSGSQFRNWLFNSGQRTYKRKKTVWLCGICSGQEIDPVARKKSRRRWKFFIGFFVLAMISNAIIGEDNNPKKSSQQSIKTQSSP